MRLNKRTVLMFTFLIALTLVLSGCMEKEGDNENRAIHDADSGDDNMGIQKIEVSSTAFEPEGMIPAKYTCDGANLNPPLRFKGIPPEAISLALIVDDPDAPGGTFTHWVVWNIDPVSNIEEDSVPGIEGINSFRSLGYRGPCPPSGAHRYFFKVYALDTRIEARAGTGRKEIEAAMVGHILAKGELVGKYRLG